MSDATAPAAPATIAASHEDGASEAPTGGIAMVTPSFVGDLPLFSRLHESFSRFAGPECEHLVVVPRSDKAAFKPFAGPRTRILAMEELFPVPFLKLPGWMTPLRSGREMYVSWRTIPVRGWIMQQMVKIGAALLTDRDTLLYCDSDVMLVRPLTANSLGAPDGRLRLFREKDVTGHLPSHQRWYEAIETLLDVPKASFYGDNYVQDLITWHRPHALALMERLEQTSGRPWWISLANTLHFSEYMLYGIFCEHVLGESGCVQTPDDRKLVLTSWDFDLGSPIGQEAFATGLEAHHIGVTVQSQSKVPPDLRNALLDRVAASAQEA
ncbi:MAG: DUF6492 family protein [Rhodospirillaceae bacterium]